MLTHILLTSNLVKLLLTTQDYIFLYIQTGTCILFSPSVNTAPLYNIKQLTSKNVIFDCFKCVNVDF